MKCGTVDFGSMFFFEWGMKSQKKTSKCLGVGVSTVSKNDIVSQTVAGLVHEFMEMLGSGEAGDGFNDLGANRNGTVNIW